MHYLQNILVRIRFWIGLLISLLGGLIGIGLFREWIKCNFSRIDDSHLDFVSLFILVIGLIITATDHSFQSRKLKQLEDEQKGRTLKHTQRKNLLKALNNLGKIKVYLMGIQGDREAIKFANTLKDIFIEAGWEVDGVWEDIIGGIGSGVTVREKSTSPNSTGKIINEIMNENHIKSRVVVLKADRNPNQIEIIVGSRP